MLSRKKLLASVSKVVQKELIGYKFDLFVFGSQANKPELMASDIDLGIKANKPIAPKQISRIKQVLNDELPSLYTFDVVDFKNVDSSFAEVAMHNVEYLYNDTSKSKG